MENPQEVILDSQLVSAELKSIAQKVFRGERITFDEGVYLFEHANLSYLGTLANFVREKKNKNLVYFNRNFHVEPTNICVYTCSFVLTRALSNNAQKAGSCLLNKCLIL